LRVPAGFAHKTSDTIALGAAATLPKAYTTAHYALEHIARLQSGETVLIHEAADAVGQAGIQIASNVGAKIFATVRSEEEKSHLIENYGIHKTRVFSSQGLKFVTALRRATKGRGVDVILNTMSGEALQATFSCIAPLGRFVNLNTQRTCRLEMAPFGRNVSFSSVDMALMYKRKPELASQVFQEAMGAITTAHHQAVRAMPWSKLDEAVKMVQEESWNRRVVMMPQADDQVLVSHI
jgi:NADPH:quinone reductase-like Zn-dependent oxidoreductase